MLNSSSEAVEQQVLDVELDAGIFNSLYLPHLENYSRTQIYYGGSSSGKSVFLSQRVVYDLLQGDRNYLICRQVGRTIRRSVFAEISKVITDWKVDHLFGISVSNLTITCKSNRHQALFVGLDDAEKIKSITPERGALTDIWIEEATETERDSIKSLYKRQRGGDEWTSKRLTLSFNPIIQQHWIYDEYFAAIGWAGEQTSYSTPDLSIQKSWYVHNKFLTSGDIHDLTAETDPYYSAVYTYGNWGVLGHVIFTKWHVQDLSGMRDQFTTHRHGLDFGYSTNPAALSVGHYDAAHKQLFIYDELYEKELTNDLLAAEVIKLVGGQPVTCDSSEPKSIAELKTHGVNAIHAKKGPDSVLFGIQWLQQQEVIMDTKCINHRNEWLGYKWKEDRNGVALAEPVDRNNHLVDARRYGSEQDMIVRAKARSYES